MKRPPMSAFHPLRTLAPPATLDPIVERDRGEVAMAFRRCLLTTGAVASLIGAAQETKAQSSDLPKVTEAKAGPCRMTVSGEGSSFFVVVSGLQANEPLKITSRSEGEVLSWESTAQGDGRYVTVTIPLVRGKSFGTANLEVVGRRCRIQASYPWRQ